LVIAVLITVLFLLCQFPVREVGWAGGNCVRSLTGSSEDAHPALAWTALGWPLRFVTITEEGCFDDRTTRTSWHVKGLLVDTLVVGGLGSLSQ
jgi:hypothetical protein